MLLQHRLARIEADPGPLPGQEWWDKNKPPPPPTKEELEKAKKLQAFIDRTVMAGRQDAWQSVQEYRAGRIRRFGEIAAPYIDARQDDRRYAVNPWDYEAQKRAMLASDVGPMAGMHPAAIERERALVAEEQREEAMEKAHDDAQKALRVAQGVLRGVDEIAAGVQKGGLGGFLQGAGGVLGMLAMIPGPHQVPLAIAAGGLQMAGRYAPGRGDDRAPARPGGYGPQPWRPNGGFGSGVTVHMDADGLAADLGRNIASGR